MVCPSCGAQILGPGKFCATCGGQLPEEAPPPAQYAAPPPAQYGAPQYGAPQYGAPQYGAPQYGAPQYGPPPYGAPQYGAPQYGPPPYGAPQYGAPAYGASATAAGATPIGGLLALAGGAAAIVSAWLPWLTSGSMSSKPLDSTNMSVLECGNYLLIGGGIAAACGLLLLLRAGRGTSLPQLLGIAALAGGILVVAVEVLTYNKLNDAIKATSAYSSYYGGASAVAIGYGLYVGLAGGVGAALGGLMGLGNRR